MHDLSLWIKLLKPIHISVFSICEKCESIHAKLIGIFKRDGFSILNHFGYGCNSYDIENPSLFFIITIISIIWIIFFGNKCAFNKILSSISIFVLAMSSLSIIFWLSKSIFTFIILLNEIIDIFNYWYVVILKNLIYYTKL